jgi:HprK-related kinase A
VAADTDYADFHVGVHKPPGIGSWLSRQVVFSVDGETPFNPLPGDQGFPLLEWGLNWCVSSQCHQFLIVHAAVLERGGRALLIPAPSGSGKSTLAAGLVYAGGWRLLSDEMALIDPPTGSVWPLPRPLSLKNDSIDLIRGLAPDARFGQEVQETAKGRVVHVAPPSEAVSRAAEPARPAWLVVPRYEPGTPARFEAMTRGRGFMQIVDNAFNYHVHGRAGFRALTRVVDDCSCWHFAYGGLRDAVAAFEEWAVMQETAA